MGKDTTALNVEFNGCATLTLIPEIILDKLQLIMCKNFTIILNITIYLKFN